MHGVTAGKRQRDKRVSRFVISRYTFIELGNKTRFFLRSQSYLIDTFVDILHSYLLTIGACAENCRLVQKIGYFRARKAACHAREHTKIDFGRNGLVARMQGILAPGIDGLKRSTVAGAVRAIPGAGQVLNSMTEILAGSAMLIKNSVGAAALVVLILISFLPLVKTAVFLVLYRALAAFMEPVADKRFCAAVSALGQAAALYLKLMFYAVLLFFLTTSIICAVTTLHY